MSSLHCDESISELISSFRLVNDCTVDIPERYQALVQSEIVYAAEDYASAPGTPFSTSWRRRIAEWLFQVADAYHLSRETVNISMSFLDRYLSKTTVNKKYFQLASMTAFFLAAKMQENRPMKMVSGFCLTAHTLLKLFFWGL
ncbi:hypothetical protein TrCOL_g4338 [Triparma columacea]|uniref:Cyclin-like domain-containing protein n=1 Tax=Triparma columacea TaxID=722753 RepID=A0A9W7GDD5_9STRA|nr:hypothetical protein TrCOL_g4338 [Triparma columacea]